MEPTFSRIRGKETSIKTAAISQLTQGQQALCMFRVMYDHAKNSSSEYYAWISYLLDKPSYWNGVTGGLRFFGDAPMLELLKDTEKVLKARNDKLGLQWSDAAFNDLGHDDVLLSTVNLLFERFLLIAPNSLKLISTYIRSNPQQFVEIENE
ncbi:MULTISPECIES: hypothetical protein [Bacillales]|uniref:hypothetical protein n=1 Tax=Bacillales TaxID=1385 RepID=UPI0006A76312|nr:MULTISPECIES: hypothetical protein [Bacillales]OBZ17526.1 hypothetical protein A7975_06590 [Bacillus sp. FJAT-26390]